MKRLASGSSDALRTTSEPLRHPASGLPRDERGPVRQPTREAFFDMSRDDIACVRDLDDKPRLPTVRQRGELAYKLVDERVTRGRDAAEVQDDLGGSPEIRQRSFADGLATRTADERRAI